MRCLLCHKELGCDDLYDLLISNDILCNACRSTWKKEDIHFQLRGIHGYAPYVYEENFAHSLLQYKEVGDEALQDIFLWKLKDKIRRRYHGYTLCCMPSSYTKLQQRGFSHLPLMFKCLGMEVLEPFEQIEDWNQKNLPGKIRHTMEHNIRLKKSITIPEKALLCDDTVTTGATLIGALSVLPKSVSVEILCVSANAFYVKKKGKHGEK